MTSRRLTDQPQPIRAPDDVVAVLRNGLAWAQQHPEQATRVQELTRDFERKSPSEQFLYRFRLKHERTMWDCGRQKKFLPTTKRRSSIRKDPLHQTFILSTHLMRRGALCGMRSWQSA